MKKNTIIALVILLVLILLSLVCYLTLSPNASQGRKVITVEVEHLNYPDSSITLSTRATTLRDALEEKGIISGTESSYGLWVTTVDGETANESNDEWWGYTVNGEFAQYGVDEMMIEDGDVYVFTLNVGY